MFENADLTNEAVAGHGKEKEKLYRDMIGPELPRLLVPGVREFARRHSDLPMAVASNAEPENVTFVLEKAGIRGLFRVVVDGHEVKRPKPDPEIYLTVAARLEVSPRDCIVFEDSHTGITAAKAAGMKVVGVATTVSEFPHVDLTIQDFEDPTLDAWLRDTFSHA